MGGDIVEFVFVAILGGPEDQALVVVEVELDGLGWWAMFVCSGGQQRQGMTGLCLLSDG